MSPDKFSNAVLKKPLTQFREIWAHLDQPAFKAAMEKGFPPHKVYGITEDYERNIFLPFQQTLANLETAYTAVSIGFSPLKLLDFLRDYDSANRPSAQLRAALNPKAMQEYRNTIAQISKSIDTRRQYLLDNDMNPEGVNALSDALASLHNFSEAIEAAEPRLNAMDRKSVLGELISRFKEFEKEQGADRRPYDSKKKGRG